MLLPKIILELRNLTVAQRRFVHVLAQKNNLRHTTKHINDQENIMIISNFTVVVGEKRDRAIT